MGLRKWLQDRSDEIIKQQQEELDALRHQKSEIIAQNEAEVQRLRNERDRVRDEISEVRGQLRDLEQRRDAEKRDIEHLLKLEREREEVAREKFEAKCERERDDGIAEVKDQYRDKMEDNLNGQIERMERMYGEILQRLPNVTAHIGDPSIRS